MEPGRFEWPVAGVPQRLPPIAAEPGLRPLTIPPDTPTTFVGFACHCISCVTFTPGVPFTVAVAESGKVPPRGTRSGDGPMMRFVTVVVEAQTQTPPLHEVPTGAHDTPHAPQLFTSVSMSLTVTQVLPHSCEGLAHEHTPEVHAVPPGQSEVTLQTWEPGGHEDEHVATLWPALWQHTSDEPQPTLSVARPNAPFSRARTVVLPEAPLTVVARPGVDVEKVKSDP